MLELPDRHASLELLDDEAHRVERRCAMRMRRNDRDAHVSECKSTEPMLDENTRDAELLIRLTGNRGHLTFRHASIGRVLDAAHGTTIVHVAHAAEEHSGRSARI